MVVYNFFLLLYSTWKHALRINKICLHAADLLKLWCLKISKYKTRDKRTDQIYTLCWIHDMQNANVKVKVWGYTILCVCVCVWSSVWITWHCVHLCVCHNNMMCCEVTHLHTEHWTDPQRRCDDVFIASCFTSYDKLFSVMRNLTKWWHRKVNVSLFTFPFKSRLTLTFCWRSSWVHVRAAADNIIHPSSMFLAFTRAEIRRKSW